MIDTSKYEGHTEGPWVWDGPILTNHEAIHWCYGTKGVDIVDIGHRKVGPMVQEPDLQLLADAPLLLEEYKRLRGWIEQAVDVWKNCNYADRTDWFNNFCEVMGDEEE